MKRMMFVFFIAMSLVLVSCVTQSSYSYDSKIRNIEPISFENDSVSGTVSFSRSDGKFVDVIIKNKTNSVVTLNIDLSQFSESSGTSHKLVPEGTKFIDAKGTLPPSIIPPNGSFCKSFFSANSIDYETGKYGGWKINSWLPPNLDNCSFIFAYKIGQVEDFIIFNGSDTKKDEEPVVIDRVYVTKTFWNVLFMPSPEYRRMTLKSMALKKAQDKHGDNVSLANLNYQGDWNPLSLVLYFSLFGFVENASLSADVVPSL